MSSNYDPLGYQGSEEEQRRRAARAEPQPLSYQGGGSAPTEQPIEPYHSSSQTDAQTFAQTAMASPLAAMGSMASMNQADQARQEQERQQQKQQNTQMLMSILSSAGG